MRGDVLLTWGAVSGISHYEVQVSNNTSFSPVLYETNVLGGATSVSLNSLPLGTHYWRVRSVALAGVSYSAYSKVYSFTHVAPTVPVLSSPANVATTAAQPTFTWAASTGAANYQFQLASDATFTNMVYDSGSISSRSVTPQLASLGTYYWRVRALDSAGNASAYSAPFKIITAIPAVVVLSTPSSGASVYGPINLTWVALNGVSSYTVQVDTTSLFNSANLTTTEVTASPFSLPGLPAAVTGSTYYWRVRANDVLGNSGPYSVYRSMVVKPPAPPTLLQPKKGAVLTTLPVFSWRTTTGAAEAELQVDDNASFISPEVTTAWLVTSQYTVAPGMLLQGVNRVYYWRLRSRDAFGNTGSYSSAFSFTLK